MKSSLIIETVALLFAAGAFAAESPGSRWDLTHGNVRVVLMSVSQTTVLPNAKDQATQEPPGGRKEAVPCFTVTALVEALGEKPLAPIRSLDVQVLSGGKPLTLVNARGLYHQLFDYRVFQDFLDFSKPKVANPKRAFVLRCATFGSLPKLEPVTLRIKAGFGDDAQTFEFASVPFQ